MSSTTTKSRPDASEVSARSAGDAHAQSAKTLLQGLHTNAQQGLSAAQADENLQRFGPNELSAKARESGWLRFLKQFKNLLIVVLLVAAVLAAVLGEWLEAGVILAVVLANTLIGFFQEGKAEQALNAIQSMLSESAQVIRDGVTETIEARDLVVGDIVVLQAGDRVPADLRLLKVNNLAVQEAALTGESVAVNKQTDPLPGATSLADRTNMAYSGTVVTQGQAHAVVVATGADTELGRVNRMLANVEQLTTPLLRQMAQFARYLTFVILVVGALVFALGMLRGYDANYMFMAVVSLVVAAIPEGLPTILTVALAIGVTRMASRHAIIRRLPAVETIGAVSVICSDKTGTLTRNEMTVTSVLTGAGLYQVSGSGYRPEGEVRADSGAMPALTEQARLIAVLCNEARLVPPEEQADTAGSAADYTVEGDPMEGALLSFAMKAGADEQQLHKRWSRQTEIPFDSSYKYMATLHHETSSDTQFILMKGAPEAVLQRCSRVWDSQQPFNVEQWHQQIDAFAQTGHRVLALACKSHQGDQLAHEDLVDLEIVALVAIMDPPRDEAIKAIDTCRQAGIAVKMITGDHAKTAQAIGAMLHLEHTDHALTGKDIDELDDQQLAEALGNTDIFARTTPEHKLRLVTLLQADNRVVAMTGDGVNDAPALKRADIGIAMGKGGTAAARDASEMVLTDDNFASIVEAVHEGRTVYDNLKKAITFLLPVNGGESLAIILALLIGLTLPIMPLQILWVNMVSSIALALALAFEQSEADAMQRPPRRANEPWLSGFVVWRVIFVSILFTIGIFSMFEWAQSQGYSEAYARTLAVNTLVAMEVFYLFSVRYLRRSSLFTQGVKGTRHVLAAVGLVLVLQLLFTYAPWLQALFDTRNMSVVHGLLCIGAGVILFVVLELEKWAQRRWRKV
ncbi:MAG: HAD-IC family P-type ATPase [Idiomarina sp.]|nr:HAD-IC family P-type ATPase [Idiomarina sp.]